jgi:hypothetical protein
MNMDGCTSGIVTIGMELIDHYVARHCSFCTELPGEFAFLAECKLATQLRRMTRRACILFFSCNTYAYVFVVGSKSASKLNSRHFG